jgi:hypothetical protein
MTVCKVDGTRCCRRADYPGFGHSSMPTHDKFEYTSCQRSAHKGMLFRTCDRMKQWKCKMGIQNRDYMQRPEDDDESRSVDSNVEDFLARFLQRNPRFFLYVSLGLGLFIALALGVAFFG